MRSSMTMRARMRVAADTTAETGAMTAAYASRGATLATEFLTLSSLPALTEAESPGFTGTVCQVVSADSFEAMRQMRTAGAQEATIGVLNLASDLYPGGGWDTVLSETQEEALCYSSTLFGALDAERDRYPWPNTGPGSDAGLFSPGIVVWKDTLPRQCAPLPEADRAVVAVLTVAAPRGPKRDPTGNWFADGPVLDDMRRKIRLVFRMAARRGRTNLILGAMGCGAYCCPQRGVAQEMRRVMLEPEWAGWFERVWVAVVDPMGEGNLGVFGEFMHGVPLPEKSGGPAATAV